MQKFSFCHYPTGAWIITGGTHAGVMKHVGEAVKDFGLATSSQNPVVVIGIAPWGCIQNRELLIEEEVRINIILFIYKNIETFVIFNSLQGNFSCYQGSHRLENYLNLEGYLEKSLKNKSTLKSTGKSLKSLEMSLNSTIFCRT